MPWSPRRLPRRRALSLLAAAVTGTLAAAPLLGALGAHPLAARHPAPRPALGAPLAVPEPPTWPLLAAGLAGLGAAVAARRRAARPA